jgi:8-amino-7-oxononanoate synthase
MSEALRRFRAGLVAGLEARRTAGLLRAPALPSGIDLSSNDYLGYAADPDLEERVAAAVRRLGIGSGASRLMRGHHPIFEETEARLAGFCGTPRSLLFSSGYALNTGLLQAIAGREDTIACDALAHASLIDGIVLSRARRLRFPHQDFDALAARLRRAPARRGRLFIVTESLFSMDGDLTDLRALCDLAERHDALLIVDEAHATGLYGPRGAGRVEELGLRDRVLCTLHTGGKALGVGGAWVAGDEILAAHLVNTCRSFIFSTAPVPALAAGLLAALQRRAGDDATVERLHRTAAVFRRRLRDTGIDILRSDSPIVPVLLGGNDRAVAVAARLRDDGFDVRAVRPPTVPEGSARLRLTVRAPVAAADLERCADRLAVHLREGRA